jgi:hypothetical protein
MTRFQLSAEGTAKYHEELARRDKEAFAYLLADKRGRWFLARLGQKNFIGATTFTNNAESYFKEGKRTAVLVLYQEIREAGREFSRLLSQAEAERQETAESIIEDIQKGVIR